MQQTLTDAPTHHTAATHYDRALSDLALVLAHRIRGLVASIEGYADLLTDTLITREQRELSFRIIEGATRIERVLADLQLFSERLEPVPLPLNVHRLMDEVLAPLAEEDRGRISVQIVESGFPEFMADPFLIRQAMYVLVQNALDATRRVGSVRIEVVTGRGGGELLFNVGNDGIIESEEPAQQVFSPFYTTKAQNMGIGLPMARKIAESHGGRLELMENSEERGIVFSLSLPLR